MKTWRMTDEELETIQYLEGRLLGMANLYPIAYGRMKEDINTKRGVWSNELLAEIDKRLTKYEESLDE